MTKNELQKFKNVFLVLYFLYSILRVFESSKKDKNVMPCTIRYLDPMETLTGQERKSIIVRNGQSCRSHSPDLVLLKYQSPLPPINWRVLD